jgi:release factor glutamine methyltransferase
MNAISCSEALLYAQKLLSEHNIDDSYFESRILLCHVLGISPAQLYSRPEYILNSNEYENLVSLLHRRQNHEPTSYLTGQREFYGINLAVNSNVLIPRPETELLVEQSIETIKQNPRFLNGETISIADIGTGSGAISIGIASNIDNIKIYAVDISEKALDIARLNINKYGLDDKIITLYGNLLNSLPEPVDLIVANLPYIREADIDALMPEIKYFEPYIALNGGYDGIDRIRELLLKSTCYLKADGCILLEIGQGQYTSIKNILHLYLNKADYILIDDFNGIPRILKVSLS